MTYSVMPLKRVLSRNDGGVWGEEPQGLADSVVLRSTDQSANGQWLEVEPALRSLTRSEHVKAQLLAGDLLLTKSSGSAQHIGKTTLVTEAIAELKPAFSNFMQRLRVRSGNAPAFYWYCFRSTFVRNQLNLISTTTTGLANLNASTIGDLIVPVPKVEEQRLIADYLDVQTAKIDTLIEKQEQLIELLAERRQAVISHAVTKGLDPNVTMTESGYEWVGQTPAHWRASPFVRLTTGRVDYRGATPRKTTEGVQLITARNVKKGFIDREASREYVAEEDYAVVMSRGIPEIGDVLLTMEAPLGNVAIVNDVDVAFAQRIIKFRLDRTKLLPGFANYLLNGFQFQQQLLSKATGSTALGLKASKLIELLVSTPPLAEQKQIIEHLDHETSRIDALSSKAGEMIDILKERRQALISAAVTGKIDVRGMVSA